MKYRIRKLFALTLALSMLLSLIPFYGAAVDDEFAGYETLEEIPFEFELEPGDLPFEQLKDAVLAAEDIPACIDPALAEARGHVNRLYLQEPDDYTVMFQNRDGSKTIYVFSHPVKGMTASMTAAIQVNGSVVSFTGTNAITSRIAELSDYNIGYSEVAYIPTGILSADGIDLTEDARGWARGESMPSALSYNISSEAAAEYAASVSVPNTDVATAAVAPGVTITPNDPAPLGGMTVMSISYSTLAGLMSFQNAATEQYLTMRTSATNPLLVNDNIVVPFSRWIVSYDSTYGYTVTNLYQPANYYLGLDDSDALAVTSLNNLTAAFTIAIVSTADSKVTISFGNKAIDSTASVYSNDPSAASFPTSCEWFIYTKTDCDLVESITPTSNVRTVNSGAIFYGEYTTAPTTPTYSDIELYFASNDQIVSSDSDYDLPDSTAYCISALGTYAVYYKDNCTGVKSANFTLNVVEYVTEITVTSSVRIEQKNVGFELDYSFTPPTSTYYSISLYYADTNTEVSHTGDTYTISTPGVYTVYYKDSVSGVTSGDFTLIVTETSGGGSPVNFPSNHTYAIQPYGHGDLFLTMTDVDNNGTTANSFSVESLITEWYNQSQTFVFNTAYGDSYSRTIFATLSTVQSGAPANYRTSTVYQYTQPYYYPNVDNICNSLSCFYGSDYPDGAKKSDPESTVQVYDLGGYYIISFGLSSNNKLLALKYDANAASDENNVIVAEYSPSETSFRWNISYVGIDTPLIKQTHSAGCGATATLMYMNGMDLDDAITALNAGSNLTAQQTQLRTLLNYTNKNYIMPAYIQPYLNGIYSNLDNNPIQNYGEFYTDEDDILEKLPNEISNYRITMARIESDTLTYYENIENHIAHYLVFIGRIGNMYITLDCHYDDDYFGIHLVPQSELETAISHLYAKH